MVTTVIILLVVGLVAYHFMVHAPAQREKEAEQNRLNEAEAAKEAALEAERDREARQKRDREREAAEKQHYSTPFLYTSKGVPCYYPIIVVGTHPTAGLKKVVDDIESRIAAVIEANELVAKGFPIVEIYAHSPDRQKVVMWAKIVNGITYNDIRE